MRASPALTSVGDIPCCELSWMLLYPVLKVEIETCERFLEQRLLDGSITPPRSLKQQVMRKLNPDAGMRWRKPNTPVDNSYTFINIAPQPVNILRFYRVAMIVVCILLAGSSILSIYYYHRGLEYQQGYSTLMALREKAKDDSKVSSVRYDALLSSSTTRVITLDYIAGNPLYRATLFWDTKSNVLYSLVDSLPEIAKGHCFKVWGMKYGKAKDAGLLKAGKDLLRLKNISEADYFLVTIEENGEQFSPSMDRIIFLGKLDRD